MSLFYAHTLHQVIYSSCRMLRRMSLTVQRYFKPALNLGLWRAGVSSGLTANSSARYCSAGVRSNWSIK